MTGDTPGAKHWEMIADGLHREGWSYPERARAIERLTGMLLVMLAVQMFLNGLRNYIQP
jgi:hypothetical protein